MIHPYHCLLAAIALLLTAGPALSQSGVTARGNEPFWSLEIATEAMTFSTPDGEPLKISPVPAPISANNVDLYVTTADGQPFVAVLADQLCVDDMSGMSFPRTAIVAIGERQFTGCGGESATLLHGDWRITAIGTTPVIATSEPTMTFSPDGKIGGNASCNRYFGNFTLTGEGLSFSEAGATMMACDGPLMQQESSFLAALETITGFGITSTNQLTLLGADGQPAITLSK
jgi:heat shock protein HslJ